MDALIWFGLHLGQILLVVVPLLVALAFFM